MISPDHDWRFDLPGRNQIVESETGTIPLAVTEPADPRG